MARKKKNERVILEDIELKPQVIGYTFQKKSNLGRVIFIFIAFLIVVYYINDISLWIDNLFGKKSPETIENLAGSNNTDDDGKNNEKNEIIYNIYQTNLVINENGMTLSGFNYNNGILTFNVVNNNNKTLDLSSKKYFLETYSEDKTLLERFKLDINVINENSQISFSLDMKNSFYYLVLEEKTIDDYPVVTLKTDELGVANITCTKGVESIIYTFKNNVLESINHTITDSNITDADYYKRYSAYQSKVASYNTLTGITATFNGTLNGYTAIIAIELDKVNLSTIYEKYYYGYKEVPKVVKFEMQTYGFECK
ncbi:MAG: hypothetical protein E7161_00995 [Firmicutes bacterium]|nr:hypothetical protein [Bacillota bacterium]